MKWKCKIFGHKLKKGIFAPYCERCGHSKINTEKAVELHKKMWKLLEDKLIK